MFYKVRLFLSITLLSLSLISCSKDEANSAENLTGRIGSTEFIVQDSSDLRFDGVSLRGSGTAIAKLPADEIAGEKNFELTFTLNNGGVVEIKAFGNDLLQNAVGIKFSRTGDTLKVELTNKTTTLDISSAFSQLDANSTLSLHFDVHNGETPAHIIGWTSSIQSPDSSNSSFDSERDEDTFGAFSGKGEGVYWGLSLQDSTVSQANLREVKFED